MTHSFDDAFRIPTPKSDDIFQDMHRLYEQEHDNDDVLQELGLDPAQREERERDRERGEKGGGGSGGSQDSGDAGNTSADAADDPDPQRDDPDDGEHKDDTVEEAAPELPGRTTKSSPRKSRQEIHEQARRRQAEKERATEQQEARTSAAQQSARQRARDQKLRRREAKRQRAQRFRRDDGRLDAQAAQAGTEYPQLDRSGFRYDGELTKINKFPAVFVDILRHEIEPFVGKAFADGISAQSLVTAFVAARLHERVEDADHNTTVAYNALKLSQPELAEMSYRIEQLESTIGSYEHALRRSVTGLRENTDLLHYVEWLTAYWFTDRMYGITTGGSVQDTMLANRDKVLNARQEARSVADDQRRRERDADGRMQP